MAKKVKEKKKIDWLFVFITILFLILIQMSFIIKSDYKEMVNKLFSGSYYYMDEDNYNKNYNRIKDKYETDNLMSIVNIEVPLSTCGIDMIIDNTLKDDEVGIPYSFIQKGIDYSENRIKLLNYNFNKTYGYNTKYAILAINENTLNKLGLKYKKEYVFELKDWSKAYKVKDVSQCSTNDSNDASKYINRSELLSLVPFILGTLYIALIILEIIKNKK